MIRFLVVLLIAGSTVGCKTIYEQYDRVRFGENPYVEPPFYARYLNETDPTDRQMLQLLDVLRENPDSAAAHNELGQLLVAKGFPNDAEREFRRALDADADFHPAWYNLALVQEAKGHESAAMRSLRQTVDLKPGHAAAHFQLGLLFEKRGMSDRAVEHYAKAFRFNRGLLDVRNNPRIVDTQLTDRALLKLYPTEHARRSMRFQPTPPDYIPPDTGPDQAPSEQPAGTEIVTPAPPVTEPSQQPPAPPNRPPGR